MEVVFLTVGLMGGLMLAMAVGAIFRGKPLKGSCGGVGGSCPCDEAGKPGACKTEGGLPPAGTPPSGPTTRTLSDGVMIYEPASSR